MSEYALEGPKWAHNAITWSFGSGAPFSGAIDSQYRATVQAALNAWSAAANVGFQQLADGASSADITVGWGRLAGGGSGGDADVVGRTSYTTNTGDNQFAQATVQLEDPAQRPLLGSAAQGYTWQGSSVTFYQVALHEIGHALGLDHSSDPQAVMYAVATAANTALGIADAAGAQQLYGAPLGAAIGVADTTQGVSAELRGDPYTGPVANLQRQYVYSGTDGVSISGSVPGLFLKGGSGEDALAVSSGRNVLDGDAGSNLLVGGTGAVSQDTFFVDGRTTAPVWSTVANFHAGDTATLWGYLPGVTKLTWTDGQGAAGYTGATLHADMRSDGTAMASLTFAGLTSAQAQAMVAGSGTAGGIPYLQFAA